MRIACLILVIGLLAGCDRDTGTPLPPAQKPARVVEVRSLTPLLPGRRTHVAPTGTGQVFWVQEAESGRETVFSLTEGQLPVATKFSSTTILEAMGQPSASGSIQSLAVGSDRNLYFYFSGGSRRRMIAAFGYFSPGNGQTKILADTAKLASVSGMGESLTLARGSIVRAGNVLWLWLRHEDGFALLSLDVSQPGTQLAKIFERVRGDGKGLLLNSAREDLSATEANSLFYLDRTSGKLWTIGAMGETLGARDLSDLPREVTTPVVDESPRMVMFAPDGPGFKQKDDDPLVETTQETELPALMIVEGDKRTTLPRKSFDAPSRFNLRSLALQGLARDRSGWVAYDAASGELLRLVVVDR